MKKNQLFSHVLVMIFCLGVMLPLTNNSIAVTDTGEVPIVGDMATSDPPIDTPFEPNANNPPVLYVPNNGALLTDTTPFFDWSTVSGFYRYNIQLSRSPSFSSGLTAYLIHSTFTPTTPLGEGLWYWRVRTSTLVIFIEVWGAFGGYRSFTIDSVPPGVPSLVSPAADVTISDNTPYFDWNPVTGCNRYRIQVDETSSFSSPTFDYQTSATGYTPSSLPDSTYYWRVSARDQAGNWGPFSSNLRKFTIDTVTPGVPSLVSPSSGTITNDNTVYLDWSSVASATLYQVQADDDPSFTSTFLDTTTASTAITTTPLADDIYYWRVRARDAVNWGAYSASRNFVVDTTSPVISSTGVTPVSPDDDDNPLFHCTVTDQNGLSSVDLHFRINSGSWDSELMFWSFGDTYEYLFAGLPYGTLVEYYFTAFDNTVPYHSALDDNGGSYYNFTVISHDTIEPTIIDVKHEPVNPTELDFIKISANITDLSGLNYSKLFYRINGGGWLYENMTSVTADIYNATIGLLVFGDFVEYYIEAADNSVIFNVAIEDNSGAYYSFTIGSSDITGPEIDSIVLPLDPTDAGAISVSCTATDDSDVFYITIYYRVNGGSWVAINMTLDTGITYTVNLGTFVYDDLVEFYLYAVDNSPIKNTSTDDNEGAYYSFTIASGDVTGPVISNVVNSQNPTSADIVKINCTITDINGILTVTLHYRINDGSWTSTTMTLNSGSTYGAAIGPFTAGAIIDYYIVAIDDSPNQNSATEDNSGAYYNFTVIAPTTDVPLYYILPILAVFSLVVLIRKRK